MSQTQSDFEGFVVAHGQDLKRLAYLLAGRDGEAEDLLQEALIKLLSRWDSVTHASSPFNYCCAVLVNLHRSWWRRAWRHREVRVPDPPDHAAPPAPGDLTDTRDALNSALRRLPPSQRTAVVLRHYLDLSEAATAEVMGCRVGTVKSQASRGLRALRQSPYLAEFAKPPVELGADNARR